MSIFSSAASESGTSSSVTSTTYYNTNDNTVNTIVGYIYRCLGNDGNTPRYGEASAAALILFGIIFLVTMVNLYVSKKKTHY